MSARSDILSAIRTRRVMSVPAPPEHRAPPPADLVQAFADRAQLASAEVRFIDSETDAPEMIADLLRARNLPAAVHVPPSCTSLPWQTVPGLTLDVASPGPDDAAVAIAPFGIAETGTLAYPSQEDSPASWHFRAGFEIAILRADTILPHFETVISRFKASGLPSTINFVTGPSRTGDIEQTLELGAHGPKALTILIVKA